MFIRVFHHQSLHMYTSFKIIHVFTCIHLFLRANTQKIGPDSLFLVKSACLSVFSSPIFLVRIPLIKNVLTFMIFLTFLYLLSKTYIRSRFHNSIISSKIYWFFLMIRMSDNDKISVTRVLKLTMRENEGIDPYDNSATEFTPRY